MQVVGPTLTIRTTRANHQAITNWYRQVFRAAGLDVHLMTDRLPQEYLEDVPTWQGG